MKFSDGQSKFSRVFNLAILGYSRNSRKLDEREKLVFYCKTIIKSAIAEEVIICYMLIMAIPDMEI